MEPDREKLTSIQVLRAVAALGVVTFHLAAEINTVGTPFPELFIGSAGVDLFFVVSGYVMVSSSSSLFGAPGGAATFLSRRLIRIVPLYWAASTVLLVHTLMRHSDLQSADLSWGALIASFAFIPYPRPSGEFGPLLKVGWTLNYEMFFYVIFAAALAFRRAVALALVVCVVAGVAIASMAVWPGAQITSVWPAPIIAEFAFGVLVGAMKLRGAQLSRWVSALLIIIGTALLLAPYAFGLTEPRLLLWGAPMAMIVAGAALGEWKGEGVFSRGMAKLGDASYALYLIHPFMILPRLLWQRLIGSDGPWIWWPMWYAAALMLGSIAVALIVHRYFEAPVTRYMKRRWASPPAATEAFQRSN
jgi:peptidoglycan/LPS O-acetylase OafA/YrhL